MEEYFGISIAELDESNSNDKDNIVLKALPIIASFIKPYPEELPLFVLRLATDVDYSSEMICF